MNPHLICSLYPLGRFFLIKARSFLMVALRSSGSESMYSCGVFASLLMAPPLQMQSCSVGVGLSSIPLGYSISSFLGVWCRNERRNSSAFGPAHEGRCTLSNSESDPEFWILLQTIAVLVLGAWLIDTGLDWSSTVNLSVISSEGAVAQGMARTLVLLVGIVVLLLRIRRS